MDAFCWNPFLVLGCPLIAGVLWWRTRRERRGLPTSAYLPRVLLVVVVAYAILRNVPTPERSWLALRSDGDLVQRVRELGPHVFGLHWQGHRR